MSAGTIPLPASDPLRFCALLAPSGSSTAERARNISGALRSRLPDLMVLADDPGFLLLAKSPQPGWALHAARKGGTHVLGALLPGTLPADALPAVLETSTDPVEVMTALTRLCWGRYVAFVHDTERQRTSFLRDPSGALRAYIWKVDGLTLITSGLPDALLDSVGVRPAVDWSALATLTALPERVGSMSALTDVSIPVPGTVYHVGSGEITTQVIWSPAAIAREEPAPVTDLPRMLANCIAGWPVRFITMRSMRFISSLVSAIFGQAVGAVRPIIVIQNMRGAAIDYVPPESRQSADRSAPFDDPQQCHRRPLSLKSPVWTCVLDD